MFHALENAWASTWLFLAAVKSRVLWTAAAANPLERFDFTRVFRREREKISFVSSSDFLFKKRVGKEGSREGHGRT